MRSFIYILFLVVTSCLFLACSLTLPKKPNPSKFPSPTVIKPPLIVEEPKVFTVGNLSYSKDNLKLQLEAIIELDSVPQSQILNELIKRKLLTAEAISMGYEKDPELEDELESQKKVILKGFNKNDSIINTIKERSYENYKFEINASHIFVPLSKYASPQDTLKLYNELISLRKYAQNKDNFGILAKEWSKDPKTYLKGGSLGWFTSLSLIYPLELAAFNTPVDSISMPIRTKTGYHIIKVNNKRKNSGTVKVQHIFKYLPPNVTKLEFDRKYKLLDSLKNLLSNGADFNTFVKKYSDDLVSKDKMGEYPIFGIGTREESTFEEASFDLNIGQVSKPVRSSSGLHLIKLLEKHRPYTKEAYFEKINDKIVTDSRGEFLIQQNLKDLSKKFNLVQHPEILNQCFNYVDIKILEKKWKKTESELEKFVLFSIGKTNYMVKEYFEYVEDRQKYYKWRNDEKPIEVFKMLYESFQNEQLQRKNEEYLYKNNEDLKFIIEEQKNDILISRIYNTLIINKSLNDSVGRRIFFENNRSMFQMREVGTLKSYTFADTTIYQKFNSLAKKPKPYQLFRGITPLYFKKNESKLNNEDKRKLIGLINILNKNKNYKVEIGGHTDPAEELRVSQLRIKQIVDFLVENGLTLTRILENDYKSSKTADRFDWSKNQRASFQFYSDSETDLVKLLNAKTPNAIVFETLNVSKQEYYNKYGLNWKNGAFTRKYSNKIELVTLTIKTEKKIQKHNNGEVIRVYQKHLETELIKNLQKKYKVEIQNEMVSKLIEEIKLKSK